MLVASSRARSEDPVLSSDGHSIAFESEATDLVAGQADTNSAPDVFLYASGTVTLASHTGNGLTAGPDNGFNRARIKFHTIRDQNCPPELNRATCLIQATCG
jgi:hypothetical protein